MEERSPLFDGFVRSAALRYLTALITVAAAYLVKSLLGVDHAGDVAFMLFLGAAFASSFVSGTGPGLFATLLGAVVAHLTLSATFIVHPPEQAHYELVRTFLFLAEGAFVSVLGGAAHGMRTQMQRTAADANLRQNVLRRKVQARETAIAEERSARVEAEEALALLRATYDTAPVGLCVLDRELRFRFINERLAEINGASVQDHIGRTLREIVPDLAPKSEEQFRRILETGEPIRGCELVGETPAQPGVLRTWIEDWFPLKDAQGRITAINVVCQEVTAQRAAADALKRSESRFSELAQHIEDVFWLTDASLERIIYVSPAYETIWGRKVSDCYENPEAWIEGIHPDDRDAVRAAFYAGIREGRYDEEYRIVRPDGCVRWVRDRGYVVRDEDARIMRFAGVATDITERHEMEQALRHSEEEYRASFALSAVGQGHADPETGRFLRVNEQFCVITGYSEQEMLWLSYFDLTHPEDRESDREAFRAMIRGEVPKYVAERRYVRKDGTIAWVHVEAVLLYDETGQPKHTVGVVTDITARKQAEDALKDANRRKDEFLAMLAHELRNPLAPMRNALELMQLVQPVETRLAHAREIMDRQLSHLTRLVDDLLDVSRITRGKIQLQKKQLILQDLIRTVVDGAHPLMEAKNQILEVDVPPEPISLEADEARIIQVVGNLLTNASKFTPHGGRISLMVGRVGDRAVIRVKDTGLGIPKEAQARIFELFAQEERTLDRSQGGLGIGLTLVKELVERHGGSVEVKSEGRGRGSEFIVSLPVLPRSVVFGADDSESEPSERRQGPMRILVVEDNRDAADSFRLLLEISGHEVQLAHDGKEGVRIAEMFRPDVAFLDIGLPEIDGFEVARRIREIPALKRTVLVALSGYGREEDKEKARAAGFDEHMTKPVEYKKIAGFLTAVSRAIVSPEPSTALH